VDQQPEALQETNRVGYETSSEPPGTAVTPRAESCLVATSRRTGHGPRLRVQTHRQGTPPCPDLTGRGVKRPQSEADHSAPSNT
jgi:hypothetical protein